MLARLCARNTYSHISILKKYNLKGHNRHAVADKFIASQKFPGIKDYR